MEEGSKRRRKAIFRSRIRMKEENEDPQVWWIINYLFLKLKVKTWYLTFPMDKFSIYSTLTWQWELMNYCSFIGIVVSFPHYCWKFFLISFLFFSSSSSFKRKNQFLKIRENRLIYLFHRNEEKLFLYTGIFICKYFSHLHIKYFIFHALFHLYSVSWADSTRLPLVGDILEII